MLLQSDRTLPPPGVAPDFVALGKQAREAAVPNQWFPVPASTIDVGLEDPENDDGPDRYFGWDVRHLSSLSLPLWGCFWGCEICCTRELLVLGPYILLRHVLFLILSSINGHADPKLC